MQFLRERGMDISNHSPKAVDQVPYFDHYQVMVSLAKEAQRVFLRRQPRPSSCSTGASKIRPRCRAPQKKSKPPTKKTFEFLRAPTSKISSRPFSATGNSQAKTRKADACNFSHPSSRARRSFSHGLALGAFALLSMTLGAGCKPHTDAGSGTEGTASGSAPSGKKQSIQNIGSDTMVNLAQAWATRGVRERSSRALDRGLGWRIGRPGIAALISKTADIANASRKMEPEEIEKAKAASGRSGRTNLSSASTNSRCT